eukprot:531828-Amorphochlora_amoeboformis.AAC.1
MNNSPDVRESNLDDESCPIMNYEFTRSLWNVDFYEKVSFTGDLDSMDHCAPQSSSRYYIPALYL